MKADNPARFSLLELLLILAIVALAIVVVARQAQAHEAPSGWSYPAECCSNQDCRPVPCDQLAPEPGGGVRWTATGDRFPQAKVKASGDGECHVCVQDGISWEDGTSYRIPFCAFTAPGA